MKKIRYILLIMIFTFFFFPNNIIAEETLKVIFTTSFAQNVNIEEIDSIYVMMDDASPKSYDIELTNEEEYRYELAGLINGNIQINDIFVNRDYSGKYTISYAKNQISANEVEIKINVSLSAPKVSTTVKVNDAVLSDIFGDRYVERITEVLPSFGTEEGYDESKITSGNNSSSSNPTSNSSGNNSSQGTTTNSYGQTDQEVEEQKKKLEEDREELEKQENIEKRNKIYTILLIVLILILLIAIVFVAIKFANANK